MNAARSSEQRYYALRQCMWRFYVEKIHRENQLTERRLRRNKLRHVVHGFDRVHSFARILAIPSYTVLGFGVLMTIASYISLFGGNTVFWHKKEVFRIVGPVFLISGCVMGIVSYLLIKRSQTGDRRVATSASMETCSTYFSYVSMHSKESTKRLERELTRCSTLSSNCSHAHNIDPRLAAQQQQQQDAFSSSGEVKDKNRRRNKLTNISVQEWLENAQLVSEIQTERTDLADTDGCDLPSEMLPSSSSMITKIATENIERENDSAEHCLLEIVPQGTPV